MRREVAILHHLAGMENIVAIIGAYEDAQNVYLVMELCSGGELFDRVISAGHYSERAAARVFRSVLRVLAHMRQMGVVHRDLKPENFLLADKSEAATLKVADFGLSCFYRAGSMLTDLCGSAYYIAPEVPACYPGLLLPLPPSQQPRRAHPSALGQVLRKRYGPEADVWSAGVILCVLLTGGPPFWGDNEAQIFARIRDGRVDFQEDPWPSISPGAKDLVLRLLQKDPAKRLAPEEALRHDWVREGGDAPDAHLGVELLRRMKAFSDLQKFKKVGLMLLVRHLKPEEVEGMRQLFMEMDTDRSGKVTIDELRRGLDKRGNKLAKAEVEALMATMDLDGSGSIDYEEFLAATVQAGKLESKESLVAAFSELDADGNGFITAAELGAKLHELGVGTNPEETEALIRQADLNGDGLIEYSEFVELMAPAHLKSRPEELGKRSREGLRTKGYW